MRLLNIAAALSGALALIMLALAQHAFAADPDVKFIYVGAGCQLAAAAAGLAIANRSGLINLIAGALIVGGAFIFSGVIYLGAVQFHAVHALAPLGGGAMIIGWLVLAFAPTNTNR